MENAAVLQECGYKILRVNGVGYRKRAYVGINLKTNEPIIIFCPCVTEKYNNIDVNNKKFINDIRVLLDLYKKYPDKCNIVPVYTSEDQLLIITKFIEGRVLYRYLCE